MPPKITVLNDFDGYFEDLVDSWCAMHSGPFKHERIMIAAGPWRASAVAYVDAGDVLWLDFYSALRNGFGALTDEDIVNIVELL
jgi:hypothetical protein